MKTLLSGNQAIARAIYEGGVRVAAGYPGTPSTEILETVSALYKDSVYCEWAPNEKVAFEVASGAALTGARAVVTMKHVGLNVAADPLLTLSYIAIPGALVIVAADDPGMHSSQNEQDSRNYARFAKIPVLEPSDSEEARDFVLEGLKISETFQTPVILRSTTRVGHSRSLLELKDREEHNPVGFQKDPPRYVTIPAWSRKMRVAVEERLGKLSEAASNSALNRIEWGERKDIGIIVSSISYQYVKEIFPEVSILKLGWSYPFPDALIKKFASEVKHLLVVEELDNFIEEHVKSLGIACDGKGITPKVGEFSPEIMRNIRETWGVALGLKSYGAIPASTPVAGLPPRPPVLCPSCPHRALFAALRKFDVVVAGDIGCYSLGTQAPLSRLDTILCMGGGFTVAHGMKVAGEQKKVVGLMGDSTFFHSGITGLLDVGYNQSAPVLIVVDNRITAMTGHQDNPGSGATLMGKPARAASIEDFAKACGINRIFVVNPLEHKKMVDTLRESLNATEATLIISRAPCVVDDRSALKPPLKIDPSVCIKCKTCLKIGCPAIEFQDNTIKINNLLCGGCGLCAQICPKKAIN